MKKFFGKKILRFVREKRARIDSELIYGTPSAKREMVLKKRTSLLGRLLNLSFVRPNKGKSYGRDYGERAKPYTREDIVNARKEK